MSRLRFAMLFACAVGVGATPMQGQVARDVVVGQTIRQQATEPFALHTLPALAGTVVRVRIVSEGRISAQLLQGPNGAPVTPVTTDSATLAFSVTVDRTDVYVIAVTADSGVKEYDLTVSVQELSGDLLRSAHDASSSAGAGKDEVFWLLANSDTPMVSLWAHNATGSWTEQMDRTTEVYEVAEQVTLLGMFTFSVLRPKSENVAYLLPADGERPTLFRFNDRRELEAVGEMYRSRILVDRRVVFGDAGEDQYWMVNGNWLRRVATERRFARLVTIGRAMVDNGEGDRVSSGLSEWFIPAADHPRGRLCTRTTIGEGAWTCLGERGRELGK